MSPYGHRHLDHAGLPALSLPATALQVGWTLTR
jgi:hypothetical protein